MINDELLDLVDNDDNVIGKKLRSEVYEKNMSNFRVINAFIKNSDGKILITRRAGTKKLFPLCLDASVGGHVKSGENYEQALKRELLEELQMPLKKVRCRLLGHLNPYKDHVSAFMNVYEIRLDETPSFNEEEIIDAYWLYPKEIIKMLKYNEKAKSDLIILIQRYYGKNDE